MSEPHSPPPLRLFNSLTRQLEDFTPVHTGEARVYTCGPTVYNYPHIGNMRAYVFADVLGRTLSFKGYKLSHVINITDEYYIDQVHPAHLVPGEGRTAFVSTNFKF